VKPETPAEALTAIVSYALGDRIEMGGHARKRMRERGVSYEDLRYALTKATHCALQSNDRWRVLGADLDGDALEVIVVIEDGVIVVTVF